MSKSTAGLNRGLIMGMLGAILVFGLPWTAAASGKNAEFKRVADEVCRLVAERFYRSDLVESVFRPAETAYRQAAARAQNAEEFAALTNDLLRCLKTSHTGFFPPNSQEYFMYLSVFEQVPAIQALFRHRKIQYPSLGIHTRTVDGRVFVFWVLDGSPAEKAGLKKGDEIVSADGLPFHPVKSLERKVGKPVILEIRRQALGNTKSLTAIPRLVNPRQEYLDALHASVKVFSAGGRKIGYVHLWSYAGEDFHQAFTEELTGGRLKDVDALIWDLRDGLGGANPTYLSLFHREVPVMHFRNRSGEGEPYDPQWRKPVVMLTNGRSKSGKEILAFGFKKHRMGTIIGEITGGAVVAGQINVLSDGSLLYLAVSGGTIDGENLEGVGVAPDIEVPMPIPYLGGEDRQLARAIQYLAKPKESDSATGLAGLAWLDGRWQSRQGDEFMEEHWSREGDAFVGMFRAMSKGKSGFFEIMAIEKDDQDTVLRIRHFGPSLKKAWEDKETAKIFRLAHLTDNEAIFEGIGAQHGERLLYRLTDRVSLHITGEFLHAGKRVIQTFALKRFSQK